MPDLDDVLRKMDESLSSAVFEPEKVASAISSDSIRTSEMVRIMEELAKRADSHTPFVMPPAPPETPFEPMTIEKLRKAVEEMEVSEKSEKPKKSLKSFVDSQARLVEKYPEAAYRVKLLKRAFEEINQKRRHGYIDDDDKGKGLTYFEIPGPMKTAVMRVDKYPLKTEHGIDESRFLMLAQTGDPDVRYSSTFEGEYYTKPFLGEEILEPIDAYIGKTGKVIIRFFELAAPAVVRTSELNEIVEIKEDIATRDLPGFAAFCDRAYSKAEVQTAEEEFKELMETIKLNTSEEQGSW